ncbi:MAG: hypothetical protein NTU41_07600, partial [Chloroflexi bacterium]|nr:hypothetical protein [Chloroflexota bacterium]
FLSVVRQTVRTKPVVVVKGGKTEAGTGAVSLHTGALSGSNKTWNALCRQAGVIRARDLKEMADTIQAFTYLKPPRGRRTAVVGVGGGANVLAADECESAGLVLPQFPSEVRRELGNFTPSVGTGLRNPLDTTTDIYMDATVLAKSVRVVADWDGVDLILVVFPTLLGVRVGIQYLRGGIEAVEEAVRGTGKPVAFVLRTANYPSGENMAWEMQEEILEAGFPVFWSFAQAAQAVNHVISYYENQAG